MRVISVSARLLVLTLVASLATALQVFAPGAADALEAATFTVTTTGYDGNGSWTQDGTDLVIDRTSIGSAEGVWLHLWNGTNYPFAMRLVAPAGTAQRLHPGTYRWAQDAPSTGRPSMAVYTGHPCDQQTGSFDIRELARNRSGAIVRLWVVWHRWCSDLNLGWGEVRFGYPRPAVDVSPDQVLWPFAVEPGDPRPGAVPVRVRRVAAATASVGTPIVAGLDAHDFAITRNGCEGSLSRSGCRIWVAFDPSGPGPRHARLRIPTSRGTVYADLDGFGRPGKSDWTVTRDSADDSYDEHLELPISVDGLTAYRIWSQAWHRFDSGDWELWDFQLSNAGLIHAGQTYQWDPDQSPYIALSRGSAALTSDIDSGWVRVDDLGYEGPDKQLTRYDLTFHFAWSYPEQNTLDGRIRFATRTDVTGPAAVSDLHGTRSGTRVSLGWTNPAAVDLARIVVRWLPGTTAPALPTSGKFGFIGGGTAATFAGTGKGPVTAAVFTVDAAGNVGGRRVITLR